MKTTLQGIPDAVDEVLETLNTAKADKIFSLDPDTGVETMENLIDVKQALAQEIDETKDELLEEIGLVETYLDSAKEDKSPNDGKLYELKNDGKLELTPSSGFLLYRLYSCSYSLY